MMLRRALLPALLVAAAALSGCGTPYATIRTPDGEALMLLGHDPVAYFTQGKAVRGDPKHKVSLPDRTYYFVSAENKRLFEANPATYEPQYGGFCSNGAPFGIKMGSDPTEWAIVDGRLFIFGDIVGHSKWSLDPAFNIKHADQMWPEVKDMGWRSATLYYWANRVPWYRTSKSLTDEWNAKHPDKPMSYNPGGFVNNVVLKYPGWRAREGFGQPALGAVGIDPCPPACPGAVSEGYKPPWPWKGSGPMVAK
jgi:YHS domain-containing protein